MTPFHIHADSSNIGTGCVLIQDFPDRKRMISANSRVFDKAEQKVSPQHRELCGLISALQTYDFMLLDPLFQFTYIVITDQFYFFGHDEDKCHIVSLSIKLFIYTEGKKLRSLTFLAETFL